LLHVICDQLQGGSIRFPHVLATTLNRKRDYIISQAQLLIFPIPKCPRILLSK
jgi:hypothetical protein